MTKKFNKKIKHNTNSNIKDNNNNNTSSTRKTRKYKSVGRLKIKKKINPINFLISDYVSFDITKYTKFTETVNIPEDIKITKTEEINMINHIEEIRNTILEKEHKFILLDDKFASAIKLWKPIVPQLSEEENKLKAIIENEKNKEKISIRKLTEILNMQDIKISKSKVHRILKNKLGYRYRKTTVKNSRLLTKYSKAMKMIFLKIIYRAIYLGYNLVFVDESKIMEKNKNLRMWRKVNENVYKNINDTKSRNLILAVDKKGMVHEKFTDNTNKSIDFQQFITELYSKIPNEKKRKQLLVFDNARIHVSKSTKKFLRNNKYKYLTTVPYLSEFNSIELEFRHIKNFLYKNLFPSALAASNAAKELMQKDSFTNVVKKNYLETLSLYINKAKKLGLIS